jgi:hypothetical protein
MLKKDRQRTGRGRTGQALYRRMNDDIYMREREKKDKEVYDRQLKMRGINPKKYKEQIEADGHDYK